MLKTNKREENFSNVLKEHKNVVIISKYTHVSNNQCCRF